MQAIRVFAMVLVLAVVPVAAQAGDFSYSHAEAGWARVAISDSEIDVQRYALGVGGNHPLSDALDVVGRVAWSTSEASGFGFSPDDDGYPASAHGTSSPTCLRSVPRSRSSKTPMHGASASG